MTSPHSFPDPITDDPPPRPRWMARLLIAITALVAVLLGANLVVDLTRPSHSLPTTPVVANTTAPGTSATPLITPSTVPSTAPAAPAPATTSCVATGSPLHYNQQRLGIAVGSSLPAPDVRGHLARILAQDFGHVRYGILRFDGEWRFVQPHGPDDFDMSAYKPVLDAVRTYNHGKAADRHICLQVIVDNAPQWANPHAHLDCQGANLCAPDAAHVAAYGAFAGRLESYLAEQGFPNNNIEVWNEPNAVEHFQPQPNPGLFVAMLRSVRAAVRRVSQWALVISGGLAPAGTDATHYSPPDFVRALYANHAKGSFDALGTHPYDGWGPTIEIRNIMVKNHDGLIPIMATEVGVHSTDADAAAHMQQLLTQGRQLPYVEAILWYSPGNDDQTFGLATASGRTKPSLLKIFNQMAGSMN